MPTGTKIAAIVLVVLLGAAGLYYAFVPPATPQKYDPSKGSNSGSSASSGIGLGGGSGLADPLSRPSTLPPAGASSNSTSNSASNSAGNSTGAGAGIDALAGRTGTNVPGASGTNGLGTVPAGGTAASATGSNVPAGAIAGNATSSADPTAPTKSYGFKNGPGSLGTPGPIGNSTATGTNPTGASNPPLANNSASSNTNTGSAGGTGNTVSTGSASTTTVAPSSSESTYVVKKGDTFETISKSVYGTTSKWREISKANPTIDPTRMKIGAKLRIPAAGASISSENTLASATPKSTSTSTSTSTSASGSGSKSTTAAATSSGTHVIAKGDTFSSLARAYYGDSKFWKAIAKANPKISEKSLAVGTKVAIPPKSSVVSGGNVER